MHTTDGLTSPMQILAEAREMSAVSQTVAIVAASHRTAQHSITPGLVLRKTNLTCFFLNQSMSVDYSTGLLRFAEWNFHCWASVS